jgi:hypothetical protein
MDIIIGGKAYPLSDEEQLALAEDVVARLGRERTIDFMAELLWHIGGGPLPPGKVLRCSIRGSAWQFYQADEE